MGAERWQNLYLDFAGALLAFFAATFLLGVFGGAGATADDVTLPAAFFFVVLAFFTAAFLVAAFVTAVFFVATFFVATFFGVAATTGASMP